MKLFFISLLILVALTAMILITSRHANDSLDGLIRQLEDLSPDDAALGERVDGICRMWEKAEKFYSLAMDRRDLAAIDSHLSELRGAALAGNRDMMLISREKLIAALERIREEVRPEISHLF